MHIRYFYTGGISWETLKESNICAILQAADELELLDLLDYLQQELIASHEAYLKSHLVELFRTTSCLGSCKKLQ
jgi:hypothetical protein